LARNIAQESSFQAIFLINIESATSNLKTVHMAIVFPAERIAQHWNGALEASLKRAPLEEFLRRHALKVAPPGATRNSDNISRAALYIMTAVLRRRSSEKNSLESQRDTLGQLTCCLCESLATLIGEPRSWRVAALTSTAQLIAPGFCSLAAASAAASAARDFTNRTRGAVSLQRLTTLTAEAVSRNSALVLLQLIGHLSQLLAAARPRTPSLTRHAAKLEPSLVVF
jgi:hypothetical protein